MEGKLQKGYQMEEILRRYFIRSGHYTVRGVPFVYQGFEVTDIDVWAYDRPSPVSRQRIIVDCKNRTTPKAIERIFWTKGLQDVLGVEQAIVATSDRRIEVVDFGREHGVVILDGNFLAKLEKSSENFADRLTEEQFVDLLASYSPTKSRGDWNDRVKTAKRPFATDLGYNAINGWIEEAHFFAEQVQIVQTHDEAACRVLFLMLSFIAVAFDFVLKDLVFSEATTRLTIVNEGLRHGSPGMASTNQVLHLAMGLIEHYVPENRSVAIKVKERLTKDLDSLPTKILAEYVCKSSVAQELFGIAKELEVAAYNKHFVAPHVLSPAAKSYFAVFIDFWGMDRTKLLNGFMGRETKPGSSGITSSTLVKDSEVPAIPLAPQPLVPQGVSAPTDRLPAQQEENPQVAQDDEKKQDRDDGQKHFPGMK